MFCVNFFKGNFDVATSENAHFRRICAHLQEKLITQARLQFVRSMSKEFERFRTVFQGSAPLIHELHDEMTELLRNLLLRFLKLELVTGKSAISLIKILKKDLKAEDFLPTDKIEIGSEAHKNLSKLKGEGAKNAAYHTTYREIEKFMEKSAGYLAKKLPFSNVLLKNVAYFSPL